MQTAINQPTDLTSIRSFADSTPGKIVFGAAATIVVAAAAHVSIPLWFTPIPLTLQPLAVLCVGLALGPVAGFAAMVAYLLEGAAGIPVFSPAGPGGTLQLFGVGGGYLMAYPFVAAIAGGMTRALPARVPRFAAAAGACAIAVCVLFLCGASWFALLTHASFHQTLIATVAPFLPGEAIKVLIAAGVYSALARSLRN
ncbi:MAG TPA: biotin transporter BioY [Acidobacteriaceae bacterium]|jgi:biotin transport system substrate-specific component